MPNSVIAKWSFYVSYDGECFFFPSHSSQFAHNFNQLSTQKIKSLSLSPLHLPLASYPNYLQSD